MSKKFGKFSTGAAVVLNDVPKNEEEALQHGNALAYGPKSNYPVGTSGCFNVGISGGCGLTCFVYKAGECEEPDEFLENKNMTEKEKDLHFELYPDSLYAKKEQT